MAWLRGSPRLVLVVVGLLSVASLRFDAPRAGAVPDSLLGPPVGQFRVYRYSQPSLVVLDQWSDTINLVPESTDNVILSAYVEAEVKNRGVVVVYLPSGLAGPFVPLVDGHVLFATWFIGSPGCPEWLRLPGTLPRDDSEKCLIVDKMESMQVSLLAGMPSYPLRVYMQAADPARPMEVRNLVVKVLYLDNAVPANK